jgi:hypothetical protein
MTFLKRVVILAGAALILLDLVFTIRSIKRHAEMKVEPVVPTDLYEAVNVIDEVKFLSTVTRLDAKSLTHLTDDEIDNLIVFIDNFKATEVAARYVKEVETALALIDVDVDRREADKRRSTIVSLS